MKNRYPSKLKPPKIFLKIKVYSMCLDFDKSVPKYRINYSLFF